MGGTTPRKIFAAYGGDSGENRPKIFFAAKGGDNIDLVLINSFKVNFY